MSDTDFEVMVQPLCRICNRTERCHQGLKHLFVAEGQPGTLIEKPVMIESPPDQILKPQGNVRKSSGGSDALLRMLLIRKGIFTVQELADIEFELTTTGMITNDVDQP